MVKILMLIISIICFNYKIIAQIKIDNNYEEYTEIINTFDDWQWAWTLPSNVLNNSAIKVKKNNKWGVVKLVKVDINFKSKFFYNKKKNFLIPIIYENIGNFNLNKLSYIPVKQNGKWGIIDTFLNIKVEFKYDDIGLILGSYEYYKIKSNEKWGLINFNDVNNFLPIAYDAIEHIYWDKAVVVKNKKYGIVNLKNNAELSPCKYDYIWQTEVENYFQASLNNKYTIIDPNGKELVPIIYDNIFKPNGSYPMLVVVKGKKHGLIDLNGKEIYPCMYEDIIIERYYSEFNSPPPCIKLNNKYAVGNYSGKILSKFQFDKIEWKKGHYFVFGIVTLNNKMGIIDTLGKEIIPIKYDLIDDYVDFSDEKKIQLVKLNGKFGYISSKGNLITKIKYDKAESFKRCCFGKGELLASAEINGQKVTIDQFGNEKKESEKAIEPKIKIADVKKTNDIVLNRKYINTKNKSSLTFLDNGKAIMKKADGSIIGNNSIYYTYTVIKNKLILVLHIPVQNQSTSKVTESKVQIEYTIGSNRIYNDKEIRIFENDQL